MHPTNDVKSSAFSLGSQQEVCRSLPSIASCLQGNNDIDCSETNRLTKRKLIMILPKIPVRSRL